MKNNETCREVPLEDAKEGMWARLTFTEDVTDDTGKVQFHTGETVARLEETVLGDTLDGLLLRAATGMTSYLGVPDKDGCVFPLIMFGDKGVKVGKCVTDLHVYTADPRGSGDTDASDPDPEDAATGHTTVWNGVTSPTIQNARVGDLVTLSNAHYPESAVTGLVQEALQYEYDDEPKERLIRVADKYYDIDETDTDNTWNIVSLKRRVNWNAHDLPDEPGFYKAATGSVWKFDGKLYAPVIDHEGRPAKSRPENAQTPKRFLDTSVKAKRFPFTRVEARFE